MSPNIVSGAVSTVTELGKDESWLQDWLKDEPMRLGLGELDVADSATEDDRSFVATDDDRCFSVDVQLGEMEASRGFGVLDNWARNRVLHPDKTHVAVLVTEQISDRYRTTLETLAEHLPLVVVELQVWLGDAEAIVVPHVALSSDEVDLSATPAAKAAEAVAKATDDTEDAPESDEAETEDESTEATADEAPEDKDDTGVGDPWGLSQGEDDSAEEESAADEAESESSGQRLLTKVS